MYDISSSTANTKFTEKYQTYRNLLKDITLIKSGLNSLGHQCSQTTLKKIVYCFLDIFHCCKWISSVVDKVVISVAHWSTAAPSTCRAEIDSNEPKKKCDIKRSILFFLFSHITLPKIMSCLWEWLRYLFYVDLLAYFYLSFFWIISFKLDMVPAPPPSPRVNTTFRAVALSTDVSMMSSKAN